MLRKEKKREKGREMERKKKGEGRKGEGEKGRSFSVPLRVYSAPIGGHTTRHTLATLHGLSGVS